MQGTNDRIHDWTYVGYGAGLNLPYQDAARLCAASRVARDPGDVAELDASCRGSADRKRLREHPHLADPVFMQASDRMRERAWEAWIAFFLDGVADQAADAVRRATRLLQLRDEYAARLLHARGSPLPVRLLDELFSSMAITIPRAVQILGVTPPAASKAVARLDQAGIVREVTGRERYRLYVAEEILAVIEQDMPSEPADTQQLRFELRAAQADGEHDVTVAPS